MELSKYFESCSASMVVCVRETLVMVYFYFFLCLNQMKLNRVQRTLATLLTALDTGRCFQFCGGEICRNSQMGPWIPMRCQNIYSCWTALYNQDLLELFI